MTTWPKQRDLLKRFGNPSSASWASKNITYIKPPFDMYFGNAKVKRIGVNTIAANDLILILNEIWEAAGKSQKKIHEWHMDAYDGCHNVRAIRGGSDWSVHSFALALDFAARWNPLGKKPGAIKGSFTDNHPVVKIFKKHGVRWGGDYKNRKDGMHFEFVS